MTKKNGTDNKPASAAWPTPAETMIGLSAAAVNWNLAMGAMWFGATTAFWKHHVDAMQKLGPRW